MKTVFSGIQPTGKVHLGNFLGAINNWVEMSNNKNKNYFCVVDLHSLTTHPDPKTMEENILSTVKENDIIEIQAFPESNDVVGLRDLYLELSVSKSTINMVRDVIASGDEVSGTQFTRDFYTSSYSNGNLIRE